MLQLRRLRSFTKLDGTLKEYDSCFEPDILIQNHVTLFNNLDEYVKKLPETERFNCHYTLGNAQGGKTRGKGNFLGQCLVPFDVDGIDFGETKESAREVVKQFCDLFFATSGFDRAKSVVVFSGHGLHFIIQTEPWADKEYFTKHKKAYDLLCSTLEETFRGAGLNFKEIDRAVFLPNRMLRLPGTINKKPGKPDRLCKILEGRLAEQTIGWQVTADKRPSPHKKQSDKTATAAVGDDIGTRPKVDSAEVENGCAFLRHCKETPAKVNESQWYASLSILARLEDGAVRCHEYSKGHPGYSRESTDEKMKQALESAGPRTCENIDGLWKGCGECIWHGKVKTPLQIKRVEFIATETTGFMNWSKRNVPHPAYDDLVKFFERQHSYVINNQSGEVYIYDGKKYKYCSKTELRGFAGKHFFPQPNESAIIEFLHRVNRRNHVDPTFLEVNEAYINFNNGILNVKTGKLEEHSPKFGFLYVLPYDYDARALCPEFDSMMQRITVGDTELEELLLEFTGYALCDKTYRHHKALILVGEGANGKSTFLDIVKALAGAENFSALGIKEMDKDTNRALLEGKLVNVSDEMPNMAMHDTDIFKKMMGGSITIRRMYGMPTVHRCSTKLMFAANEIPATYDHSHGMFRRLIIVPFDARFNEKDVDHGLMGRVLRELPGIFNRILDAFKRLDARKHFTQAARSNEELNAYRTENDALGSAIADNLQWRDGPWAEEDFMPFQTLFDRCCSQGGRFGDKERLRKQFRKALARAVPDLKKREARRWITTEVGQPKILMRGLFGIFLARE